MHKLKSLSAKLPLIFSLVITALFILLVLVSSIVVTSIHGLFVGFHFIAFFLARDTQSSVETQFRGIS